MYVDIDKYRAGESIKGKVMSHDFPGHATIKATPDGRPQHGGWCLVPEVHERLVEQDIDYDFYYDNSRDTWYLRVADLATALRVKLTVG